MAPFLFLYFFSAAAYAEPTFDIDLIAISQSWLNLNYYEKISFDNYKSQILTPSFFIASDGVSNPKSELSATIQAQFRDENAQEWICKYPGRYQYLATENGINAELKLSKCEKLNRWKLKLNAGSLSLIYPAQSLESSLALFSHTFLKVNNESIPTNSSLHTVISYAAAFGPNESLLALAFKGVFGGYVGKFGTSYFYDELLRYGYQETRDIFEYQLNFTKDEINQMLNHLWEVQDIGIRYYFLDQNCSYYLLKLMEIGRPSLRLSQPFTLLAIPSETVRAIVENTNLVFNKNYYPSKENKRKQRLGWMSADEYKVYNQLKKNIETYPVTWHDLSAQLNVNSQAQVLDAYNDYLTYLGTEFAIQIRQKVLADRSKLTPAKLENNFMQTRSPPEAGHKPHRFGISYGRDKQVNYLGLTGRLVLHDQLDPSQSYVESTDLEAFKFDLRFQDHNIDLNSFTIFSVKTLRPINSEQTNASSKFLSMVSRPTSNRLANKKYFMNEYAKGLTLSWPGLTFNLLADLALNYHHELLDNYQAGLGAEANILTIIKPYWKIILATRYQDYSLGEKNYYSNAEVDIVWAKNIKSSWKLKIGRSNENSYSQLQMLYYF